MYKKTILKPGFKTILVPSKESDVFDILILFAVGSRYEKKEENGISHFLEHLFFKGTKKRPTQKDIAQTLDKVGGSYNAFTSKEYTGYFAKVDYSNIPLALDFLSDILLNSKFEEKEIEKEKGVIIEELKMYLDTPISYIDDLFEETLYGDQPIGWKVIGTVENIKSFKRENFLNYLKKHYLIENSILVISGKFKEKDLNNNILKYFKKFPKGFQKPKKEILDFQEKPQVKIFFKETDQTHLSIGVRGYNLNDERKYLQDIIAVILGGNMSSRLFQKIRSELGLAYYINTQSNLYTDHGYLTTKAGVPHEKVKDVIKIILEEYKKIREGKISLAELKNTKTYLKGNLILSLDDASSKANFFAFQELLTGKILTTEEILRKIEKVSLEDVKIAGHELFNPKNLNLSIIGPHKKEDFEKLLKF